MTKKYFSVRGFARILGVSKITVYRWIWEGRVKAVRLPSGRYRIPASELRRIRRGRK
jgi:putative resolvase